MSVAHSEVVAEPSAYGVAFLDGVVSKGKGNDKTALGTAPLLTVVDFAKFEAAFPGVLLKHSNGQSVRVHAQSITRNMLWSDRSTSREKMIEAQVKGICFGQAVSVTVKVVETIVEKEVELGVTKQQAMIAELVEEGWSVEKEQQFVAKIQQAQ